MLANVDAGNASRYGYEGDRYDIVGTFACRRTLTAQHGKKGFQKMRAFGVAHRTLPCGASLGICNVRTGLCTAAYVVDRGPWGALDRKGDWHLRTGPLRSGERYRGVLDLLPGVYSAIELRGIEKVVFFRLPDTKQPSTYSRLPPLRSQGQTPFAFYLLPVWDETKQTDSPDGVKHVAQLDPAQLPTTPTQRPSQPILAAVVVAKPGSTLLFPPLRDGKAPPPLVPVQSRFGVGRFAKPQPAANRPPSANS